MQITVCENSEAGECLFYWRTILYSISDIKQTKEIQKSVLD